MTAPVINEDILRVCKTLSNFKSKIENKRFLITGGAGFLGSWICDVLNSFNAKIICVDNFSSSSSKNINHLIGKEDFIFLEKNVLDFEIDEDIDYIIHMASIASPPLYQKHPIETLDANILGTKKMLELAKEKLAKAFLLTSTSEVYGNPPDESVPTSENYYGIVNSFGPRSMYDEGKRASEAYCYSFFKNFKLPIRIARIFNTYGPRLDVKNTSQYGRVVAKFIQQAVEGKSVTVYGDGSQTRSFCYITDQMIGLIKLLLADGLDGQVVNIGNEEEVTILDLAKKIISLTNSKSEIVFHELPPDDPRRRCPNISKAKELLGFKPQIDIEQGLMKTICWFKKEGISGS